MEIRKRTTSIVGAKKAAYYELLVALTLLTAFTILSVATSGFQPFYSFLSATYGPLVTGNLINTAFFMMTLLLWLSYRRWRFATQRARELEGIISSISPDAMIVDDVHRNIVQCNESIKKVFYQIIL